MSFNNNIMQCIINITYLKALLAWKEKKGDTLSTKNFTDHIASWFEAGFVHRDVWRLLRTKVARDALPPNIDLTEAPTDPVGPIGPLNKEDTVLECKISIYFKDCVKT